MAFSFNDLHLKLAERGGFEPPRRYKRLPDFESGTFNRSATSPECGCRAVPALNAGGAIIRGRLPPDKARSRLAGPIFRRNRVMSEISVPVSFGELLDKIAILQIKSERMTDPAKLANVRNELTALENTWMAHPAAGKDIARLRADLKAVNERLWVDRKSVV